MSVSKFFKEALAWRLAGGHASEHKAMNVATYATNPLTGRTAGLVDPVFGGVIGIGQTTLPKFANAISLAKAGTRNAKVLFLGDSTTAGGFASGSGYAGNRVLNTPTKFAKTLASLTGYYGNTFGDSWSSFANFQAYDPRWSFGASWTTNAVNVMGGGSINCTGAATAASFTPEQAFDTIDLYYIQNTTYGAFTLNVDGGATLGASVNSAGTLSVQKVTRTCTLGNHTLNIAKSDTNNVILIGVSTYNSAVKGVEVISAGTGGYTAGQLAVNTNVWDQCYTTATGTLGLLLPDLTIINVGINDWIASTLPATFATNLQTIIDAARLYGDVVLVAPVPESSGSISIANQRLIVSQIRQLATQNGCPLLDIHAAWGNYAYAQGTLGYYAPTNDLIHPGATGYAAIAQSVKLLLGL